MTDLTVAKTTTRLRPVEPVDIVLMGDLIGDAAQERLLAIHFAGIGTPRYERARRTHRRRVEALRRLAYALERQAPPCGPGEEWEHHTDGGEPGRPAREVPA